MLPGFRFLLAAIVLSTSMLVFGLGAAALLRAAHEQFASNPSWHAAPEATFTQQAEAVSPVLAMLHAEPAGIEPARAELKASDNVSVLNIPAVAPPVEEATNVATPTEPTAVSPAAPEQTSVAPAASQPERVAALKPGQTSAPESATPAKSAVAEDPAPSLLARAQSVAPGTEAAGSATSSSQRDSTLAPTRQAAIASVMPQANETVANETAAAETASTESASAEGEANAAAASQAGAAVSSEMDAISTKLAALNSRPLIVQPKPRPKAAIARQAARKRLARQATLRRLAAQARQATLFPFAPYPQQLSQPPGASQNPGP
jgi:hypothetical protein